MAVLLAIGALFLLIFFGVPIALALAVSATLGILFLEGFAFTSSTLASHPSTILAQNGMIVIPLFVLMGYLILHAGIAKDIYAIATRLIGRKLPGGLGVASILGCAMFAGICGSSAATVASIGRISYIEMRRHNYPESLAAGVVAMAGTLGIMIPPSSFLVIYAILAEVSIQKMLFAGIIPGFLSAFAYSLVIILQAKRQLVEVPSGGQDFTRTAGSASPVGIPAEAAAGSTSGRAAVLSVASIFLLVMGGMYTGYFTATEASAVGACAAGVLLAVLSLSNRFSLLSAFKAAIVETTVTSSMIALLLVGGGLFAYFLVVAGVPDAIATAALEAPVPPSVIIAGLLLLLIPLGMFLDGTSIMLIVTPLAVPLLMAFDLDLIWFGILLVKLIEIGLVTPPLGINIFVLVGAVRGLRAETAFRGTVPFIVAELATVALIFAFPEIALWLPDSVR